MEPEEAFGGEGKALAATENAPLPATDDTSINVPLPTVDDTPTKDPLAVENNTPTDPLLHFFPTPVRFLNK
ncbi:hypothetical protein QVD17_34779 [Tagetes erecta]|uniref:Uncharacterized protein n=1 Tax=Tagetes erecta TaxID=13708 RepID=A0AAD8NLT4_TARER|nr:hypothetical protein QVD17_34779 [Tagetes erecta]